MITDVHYRDNGKENGNYCSILGLYRDNGKENGNCCSILGLYRDRCDWLSKPQSPIPKP